MEGRSARKRGQASTEPDPSPQALNKTKDAAKNTSTDSDISELVGLAGFAPSRRIIASLSLSSHNNANNLNQAPNPKKYAESGKVHKGAASYFNDRKGESRVAAYCGYVDVADFRRFLVSFPAQDLHYAVKAIVALQTNIRWAPLFQEIRDTYRECVQADRDIFDEKFGMSVDLNARFPLVAATKQDSDANKISHIAAAFYRFKCAIEGYRDIEPTERATRTVQTHGRWKAHFFPANNDISLPEIDPEHVIVPRLGPFVEFNEDYIEPYSRMFAINSLLCIHNGNSRLKNFIQASAPFQSRPIKEDDIPRWMIAFELGKGQRDKEEENKDALRLEPKVFKLLWKMAKNTAEVKAYIKEHDLGEEISPEQSSEVDPRMLLGPEFRDLVRHQFGMMTLSGGKKLQILKMRLKYIDDEGDEASEDMVHGNWEGTIQPLLREMPESELEIVFWARLLEKTERALESTGVPSALSHIFQLGEDGLPRLRSPIIPPTAKGSEATAE